MALLGARLLGLEVFTVLSASMEPEYQTGSIIYVKEVDYRNLKRGDVITFSMGDKSVVTHRIVEALVDKKDPTMIYYRTKGDANNSDDGGLVHYKDIIGKPVFAIPKLGFFVNYIQNPPGIYLALFTGGLLIFFTLLAEAFLGLVKKATASRQIFQKKRENKKKERGHNFS